jgi:phosphatidylglycerol:prolipoprotein diacylglycerol transferase
MTISTMLTITHDMSRGIAIGDYTLRIYQLMFLLSFILGFQIVKSIFKREGADEKWMDPLLTYTVVATVIGARLGHVFFYQPEYYLKHPLEILMVWKGGLASHGAAIAIIVAMYLFSKKVSKTPLLWILDRVVIVVALAAAFIRIGNYTNSEIYGQVENSPMETVFLYPAQEYFTSYYGSFFYDVSFEETERTFEQNNIVYPIYTATFTTKQNANTERIAQEIDVNILRRLSSLDSEEQNVLPLPGAKAEIISPTEIRVELMGVPRYPTQLFEAGGYLFIFIILIFLYLKTIKKFELGFLFGTFLTLLFGFRFFIEFYKANQVGFEEDLTLNMGQYLSIPLVLVGLYFMVSSAKRPYQYSKKVGNK